MVASDCLPFLRHSQDKSALRKSLLHTGESCQTDSCKRKQYVQDPFELTTETLRKVDSQLADFLEHDVEGVRGNPL